MNIIRKPALIFFIVYGALLNGQINEKNIRDVILEKKFPTNDEHEAMDLNNDDSVDIADYILFIDSELNAEFIVAGFESNMRFVSQVEENVELIATFSEPYTGTLYFSVTGTAIEGVDYQISTRSVSVDNALEASFFITLLQNDEIKTPRSIVISIVEEPSESYRAGILDEEEMSAPASIALTIVDATDGLLSATMTFPDESIGVQSFVIGLTEQGDGSLASDWNTANAPLFSEDFSTLIAYDPQLGELGFPNTISGTFTSELRSASWSLQVSELTPVQGVANTTFVGSVTLSLFGLTSPSHTMELEGTIIISEIDQGTNE